MSSGHDSVPGPHPAGSGEHDAHSALLEQLLGEPAFAKAVQAYAKEDDRYDIPFLGGSNKAGDTIYFDRQFVAAIKAGKVQYDGKPYDPRPFIKVHEAVEGACIRLCGAKYDKPNAQGLPGGHLIATWAEQRAVDHAGLDWDKYQASLKSWIAAAEHERVANPPGDLLVEPYEGTPQGRDIVNAEQRRAPGGYVANPAQNAAVHASERERAGGAEAPEGGSAPTPRQHALTMASATHLHNSGYIGPALKSAIHGHAKAGLARMKVKKMAAAPMVFGSLAPTMGEDRER